MFVLFGFLFYLSDTLEKTHKVTGIGKGALLAIPLSALCLASYLTGKWTGKNKRVLKWVTATGFLLVTALMVVCACLNMDSKWLLLGMMMAAGVGIGISLPCMDTLITEGIDKKQRGTITSLYSSMRFIGVAVGPPITSLVMGHPVWLFIIYAGAAFLASASAIWFIRPEA